MNGDLKAMSNFTMTFFIAFVIIFMALIGLGIGYLFTGKSRLRGSCGGKANQLRGEECGKDPNCSICGQTTGNESETEKGEKS
jgi:hypothetical protein